MDFTTSTTASTNNANNGLIIIASKPPNNQHKTVLQGVQLRLHSTRNETSPITKEQWDNLREKFMTMLNNNREIGCRGTKVHEEGPLIMAKD